MQTTSLFVDTSGWMAYLSADETYHDQAGQELRQAIMTPHIAIHSSGGADAVTSHDANRASSSPRPSNELAGCTT